MKIGIVLNSISKRKKFFYQFFLPKLQQLGQVDVFETQTAVDDGLRIAKEISGYGYDIILSAGGDGTLNQVLNGLMTSPNDLPLLGVIPIGSGNDFSRAVNISDDINQHIQLIKNSTYRLMDIGEVIYSQKLNEEASDASHVRYFINEIDIGMGPVVVQKVFKNNKLLGPALSYYAAILSSFFSFKPFEIDATTPEWNWHGKIRSLAVSNGNYYGHGLCIAPEAKTDDGIFSVFIAGDVSVFDFIRCSGTLKQGKKVSLDQVFYKEAESVRLTSTLTSIFETDGELIGMLPASIKILPKKIKFLC